MKKLNQELTEQMKTFKAGKSTLMGRMKKTELKPDEPETALGQWITQKEHSCYVCDHFHSNYQRYLDTFFYMYKNSKEFAELFRNSKGSAFPISGIWWKWAKKS